MSELEQDSDDLKAFADHLHKIDIKRLSCTLSSIRNRHMVTVIASKGRLVSKYIVRSLEPTVSPLLLSDIFHLGPLELAWLGSRVSFPVSPLWIEDGLLVGHSLLLRFGLEVGS